MEERIVWSKLAFADLQDIYEYIANDSAFYAARLVDGIEKRISTLPFQPYIGRVVPETDADEIREFCMEIIALCIRYISCQRFIFTGSYAPHKTIDNVHIPGTGRFLYYWRTSII